MKTSRVQLAVSATFAGLLMLAMFSGWKCFQARAAAYAAAENFQACRQLARQIEALRGAPAQASMRQQSIQDLALRIERAAQPAKIPPSAIVRIDPQAARRVGKSSHMEQPTRMEIRQVTLEQLARFLEELASSQSGLEATSIRLAPPRVAVKDATNETWSAEVILTHLVFSPEYAAHPSRASK